MTSPYVGYRRARVAVVLLTSTSQRFGCGRAPHCFPNGKSGTDAKHGCRCHDPWRGMPAEILDPKSQRQGSGELAEVTCLLQHPNRRRNRRCCLRRSCVECPGGQAAETGRNSRRRHGDGRWRKHRGVDDKRDTANPGRSQLFRRKRGCVGEGGTVTYSPVCSNCLRASISWASALLVWT